MALKQEYKEYRVLDLPSSGLQAGDRYYLNVGGGKYKTYIVSDGLQLTEEAGNEFIECDTVDDLRNLDARQIWAIQNGYYKGVILNGYYAKGDTPAPIQYYLSDTEEEDDGGSVFEVGGVKLEHDFLNYVHVAYFGAVGNGTTDNTSYYNNIINYLENGGCVEWNAYQTYKGSFVSDKSLILIGNNSTHINSDAESPIIRFQKPTLIGHTTVTSSLTYGDIYVHVDNSSGITVGDIITIYDEKSRPADALLVNYESLLVKGVDYDNNVIEVHDYIRSEQNQGVISLDLTPSPLSNIVVNDFKFISNNDHTGGNSMHLSFFGCKDISVRNIVTSNNVGNAVGVRRCMNFDISNVVCNAPRLVGSGQGYGVTVNWSRDGRVKNIEGYSMRHTVDYSGSYSMVLEDVKDYSSRFPIELAHNMYGGNFKVKNIYVDGNVSHALHIQRQNISETVVRAYRFRDLHISDVYHTVRQKTGASIRSVNIECPIQDALINNINVINAIEDYVSTAIDAIVCIQPGTVYGTVKITDLKSNKIGTAVRLYNGGGVVSMGALELDNIYINSYTRLLYLGDIRSFTIGNFSLDGLTSGEYAIEFVSPAFLQYASFVGEIRGQSVNKHIFNPAVIFDNTLGGEPYEIIAGNNIETPVYSSTTYTRLSMGVRTQIRMIHTPSGNLSVTSDNFLPNPTHIKEEKIVCLNYPEHLGVRGDVVINSNNTNIINPDGGYGIRLKSGLSYRFKSIIQNGVYVWLVEKISSIASVNSKGGVNQSASVSDITTADATTDSASTATDVTGVVTDLNDLIVKYNAMSTLVNELKTKLNAKLAADRASGQQSTT